MNAQSSQSFQAASASKRAAALSRDALRAVEPAWRSGEVVKEYLAIVHGAPGAHGAIDVPLAARRPHQKGSGRIEEARVILGAVLHQHLQPLLGLLLAGNQLAQVQGHDPLPQELRRNVAADDAPS